MSLSGGRQSEIVRELMAVDRVDVVDLARRWGTSEVTIRRDLAELERAGLVRRVRGGAVSTLLRGDEMPFAMREVEQAREKARIADAAVGMITDGEAVVLDSGTTAAAAARKLSTRAITVMPLSVNGIAQLAGSENVSLILPGGNVRPIELSVTGPMAHESLAALRFDTMLLTCCGIDIDRGVTAFDLQDAAVKRAAIRSSARVIALADASKFSRTAMAVVCETSAVDVVVTDVAAPDDAVDRLNAAGVRVLRV